MSFFISKDLEGKVDENCLLQNKEAKVTNEFCLIFKEMTCQVSEIKFNYDNNKLKIQLNCNIHAVDELCKTNLNCTLIFKNNIFQVFDIKIDKILKKDRDNYTVDICARYTRGDNV